MDKTALDLTEMGSATVPTERVIVAVTHALEQRLQVRIVTIPYGPASHIVYANGDDADELFEVL